MIYKSKNIEKHQWGKIINSGRQFVKSEKAIPVKEFEKLVRDLSVTGENNVALWEAAGVDMSQFPKSLAKDLRVMQIDRIGKAMSGKAPGITNTANKGMITSYFDTGSSDGRLGYIQVENVGDDAGIRHIQKFGSMSRFGLDPYTAIGMDAARKYVGLNGRQLISGRELLMPKKTIPITSSYFNITPVTRLVKRADGTYSIPVSGRYHEEDLREAVIRNWMQNNPGKTPSQRELKFLLGKTNEGGMTALDDGYLNVSSFPEYFDETGNFRSDLPEEFIEELSEYLSEGRPGFYQRYIGPLKRPLTVPSRLITPFIHPNIYLDPKGNHPNLGIFSTFKNGGRFKNPLHK